MSDEKPWTTWEIEGWVPPPEGLPAVPGVWVRLAGCELPSEAVAREVFRDLKHDGQVVRLLRVERAEVMRVKEVVHEE